MSDDDLTDSERQFLLEYGGLTAADLTSEALAETDEVVARAIAAAVAEVRAGSLALSEAEALLSRSHVEVLRDVDAGDIYSVPGEHPTDEPLLPCWQFYEGRVIPHLREVVAALPDEYHPLLVRDFMTRPDDDYLDGWSPAAWLLAGRELSAVVQYADDLSWI